MENKISNDSAQTPESKQINPFLAPVQKKWYQYKWLWIIVILAITATGVCVAYFRIQQQQTSSALAIIQTHQPTIQNIPQPTITPSSTPTSSDAIATSTNTAANTTNDQVIMDGGYNLYTYTEYATSNNLSPPDVQYLDDGIINSGPYSGYHRIFASETWNDGPVGPLGQISDIFATKDFNTFIVDASSTAFSDPDSGYNKSKVVGVGDIPVNAPPQIIDLGNFVLTQNFITVSPDTVSELPSKLDGYKFYTANQLPFFQRQGTDAADKYISGISDVYVIDQYGLGYDYQFSTKEEYKRHQTETKNIIDNDFYESNEIATGTPFYNSYGALFPGDCGATGFSYNLNVSQSNLVKIATTLNGVDLYKLSDPNNPLNEEEYQDKVTNSGSDFSSINSTPAPTYNQYLSRNPVIVFQDPFGRWIGIGEWEYQTDAGCGKPVIYLYPTKPTEVTVKFLDSVNFSVDIPTYNDGWDVLADPSGQLKDLQPQYTDCQKIDYSLFGSEYSKDACRKGIYPYLYWEGRVSNPYPVANNGWIVSKDDLTNFLNAKLDQIGLNDKEKSDMISYWVPELLSENSPFYRLSFFDTQTMENFIPMKITPKPDTVIRVFLDWSPLTTMPKTPIAQEQLTHINRRGFTVVEWGGLKD